MTGIILEFVLWVALCLTALVAIFFPAADGVSVLVHFGFVFSAVYLLGVALHEANRKAGRTGGCNRDSGCTRTGTGASLRNWWGKPHCKFKSCRPDQE